MAEKIRPNIDYSALATVLTDLMTIMSTLLMLIRSGRAQRRAFH